MRLFALGDIHISYKFNEEALHQLSPTDYLNDALILCGDIGEKLSHLRTAFSLTTDRFKTVFWVPGNHELYTLPNDETGLKGERKYKECVSVANEYGVITPEDEYVTWHGEGGPVVICPIFALYDYSFRPEGVTREGALEWAAEEDVCATDEALLWPEPYGTRDEWCRALVERTEARLKKASETGMKLVIINHWPLRQDLVRIPRIPRFSLWCGTKLTEDWHTRFNAKVVVTGHLHVRRTDHIDGVRFEEVSLGYPKQWEDAREWGKDINGMLREILPGENYNGDESTIWRLRG
jgi:predicted phosphodiesterase